MSSGQALSRRLLWRQARPVCCLLYVSFFFFGLWRTPVFLCLFFFPFFFSGGSGGERCGWSERCVRLLKGPGSCRAALKGWRAAEVGAGKEVAGGWRSAGRRGVAWGACCLEKRRAQAEPTGSAERGGPRPGKRVGGDWDGTGCREGSDRWAGGPARRKALAGADGAPGTVATARGPTAGCLGKARRGWGATRRRARRRAVRRWRKRRLGLHRDLLELRRSRGRRGRRRALGRGRPARAEASTGGRPLGGRATPPRAGAGGGRGATGRGWRRRRGGCRGPGGGRCRQGDLPSQPEPGGHGQAHV